jgi:hypothetical protein
MSLESPPQSRKSAPSAGDLRAFSPDLY